MAKNHQYVSFAVIRRLPRYYRFLGELLEKGVNRTSSKDLAQMMQVLIVFVAHKIPSIILI